MPKQLHQLLYGFISLFQFEVTKIFDIFQLTSHLVFAPQGDGEHALSCADAELQT